MSINRMLATSSVLAAFTAVVHTIGGTIEIHAPLLESPLPESIRLLLYACWHLVTVALILSALALAWAARGDRARTESALPIFGGTLWSSFGAVCIAVALGFGEPSTLLVLPQWTLLIPVGVSALLGVRAARSDG
mgnify:CR=1 FL=1